MKNRNSNLERIQEEFQSKFGIKSTGGHPKKKASGNKKNDKWGGLRSRKEARKVARKKKKAQMNAVYLSRFSKQKAPVLDEVVQVVKAPPKKKAGRTGRVARYAPADSSAPAPKDTPEEEELEEENNSDKKTNKKRKRKQREEEEPSDQSEVSDDETENKGQSTIYDAVISREKQQLRQLEKQLKLKKRKTLPKAFMDDGLDYLLDIVNPDKLKSVAESEGEESDTDSDSDDDQPDSEDDQPAETVTVKKSKENTKSNLSSDGRKRKVHFADELEEEETQGSSGEEMEAEEGGSEDEDGVIDGRDSDDGMEDDNDNLEKDEDANDDEEEEEEDEMKSAKKDENDKKSRVKEDIYGRLVDSKGNLLSAAKKDSKTAYIPPAKRAAMLAESGQRSQEVERLKKQLKGLLNRASESNMQSIANAVEDLYMSNSRASVNESLSGLISEAVVSTAMTPERLVAEMAMLVAVLHGNVGTEVGAYFLQQVTKQYDHLSQQEEYGGEHTMDNVLLLLAYLYNFKVAHHTLLFDIITQLVESFTEKDIELLLLILKSAGFYLRRDDPESLGNQIIAIQNKARELEESGKEVPSRMRFMLEVLVAVRNNNVRRVPGADIERTDRMRKVAGTFIRGGGLADNQLNVGLKDLLRADETGRWWIVGSAWEGRVAEDLANSKTSAKASTSTSVTGAVSQKLVHLAKKLGMNTDVRRSIFYALMSSEDYLDAFQKVLLLGLKGKQEREIVVVAVECCKQESKYNPFYSHLLERLAKHERRFMMATQFHMWDMFKVMSETGQDGRHNLAMMLAHLLASESLSLGVLKVLEFGALEKSVVKFLKLTLTQLLTSTAVTELNLIFRKVGQQPKLRSLSDGLRVFLTKYVSVKKMENNEKKVMRNKLAEVCGELSLNRQTVL
ncbi:nucleolar MIF4G domain-containing protein 1-like isoform X2 [Littorina saxatilis]|uniref:nucleolar MIF4G domain-containing protein 1-like isoform X2 n=1 Tax=Littorina saxatilis TaxID=31220 RepID=UPI0038B449B2